MTARKGLAVRIALIGGIASSLLYIAMLVVFGGLTFLDAPGLAANVPTPWLGVWERINVLRANSVAGRQGFEPR